MCCSKAFKIARDNGWKNIQIEGDALQIISAIDSRESLVRWESKGYIEEARTFEFFFFFFNNCSLECVIRQANGAAYALCKWVSMENHFGQVNVIAIPAYLKCALAKDFSWGVG